MAGEAHPMDAAARRLNTAFAEAIAGGDMGSDTAGMPNHWVFIGTYYDSGGEQQTAVLSDHGAGSHEALALLAVGDMVWREELRRWVIGD